MGRTVSGVPCSAGKTILEGNNPGLSRRFCRCSLFHQPLPFPGLSLERIPEFLRDEVSSPRDKARGLVSVPGIFTVYLLHVTSKTAENNHIDAFIVEPGTGTRTHRPFADVLFAPFCGTSHAARRLHLNQPFF